MSPTRIAHADGLPQDVAAESEEALETSSEEQTTDPTEDETTVIDATTGEATADETPIATDEPPTQEEPLETHEPSSSSSGSLPADVAESSDTPSAEAASAATQPPHRLAPYLLMGGGSAALTLIGIATVLERRRDGAGRKPYRRRRHYA